ncbi:MAG: uracil-DNA glycosylase [Chloroflexi bacterium]|nr:uracil-DNA glycosylase [Chloroflexota bacterium]
MVKMDFNAVITKVAGCQKCARMCNSKRILGHSSGSIDSKIMFIGEAPGRLGADGSAIPFHGDKSGHNFESLLEQVGISRYDTFVTNAVLCNPKDAKGNNASPNNVEIQNCSYFLKKQIDIVQPRIIVTLGATALAALRIISHHSLTLRSSVRSANEWYERLLIPAYHPGQRAMIHRSFLNQLADYQFIAEQLRRLDVSRKVSVAPTGAVVSQLVASILSYEPEVSYFALHKIFYLVELAAVKRTGRRLTNAYIVRQKDGPYCTDLHIQKLKKSMPRLAVRSRSGKLYLGLGKNDLFEDSRCSVDPIAEEIVARVMAEYGSMKDSELKTKVYLSKPMRHILRQEKAGLPGTFNMPVRFGNEGLVSYK